MKKTLTPWLATAMMAVASGAYASDTTTKVDTKPKFELFKERALERNAEQRKCLEKSSDRDSLKACFGKRDGKVKEYKEYHIDP